MRGSVTHSVPSARALVDEVCRAYRIAAADCELLRAGTNDTYLLRSSGAVDSASMGPDRGLDRRSPMSSRPPVPGRERCERRRPLPGVDGRLMRKIGAPEGARHVVVFTYVESPPLSWSNPAHCRLVGGSAAAIHAATDDFATIHYCTPHDLTELIDCPPQALGPFLSHRPDDWTALRKITRKLRARVDVVAEEGLHWGACHSDVSVRTVRVAEGGQPFAFDFDLCEPGWRAFDLAAIHWVATARGDPRVWDAFVEGYTQMRSLGARDLAAVPLFYFVRQRWTLELLPHNAPEWGAAALNDGYLDRKVAVFRRWAVFSPVRVGGRQ
jgi:Ser/Thr protein kinase RdoA (MazF antagonist)